MAAPTLAQLSTSLTTAGLPLLSPTFLTPILSTTRPQPLAALSATAKLRAFASDIYQIPILALSSPSFPPNLSDVRVVQTSLREDVFVQVLDIEDLGRSKWEQIEALEAERNGEMKKGREIIRVAPVAADGGAEPSSAATQVLPNTQAQNAALNAVPKGPFKLLLQDHKGSKVYGFELKKVDRIGVPPAMNIGAKLMLKKGTKVARGMVLLEPATVVVFGGKIEGFDKAWRDGREQRLRREVEAEGQRE